MQAIILETRPSFPIDSIPHIEIPNGLCETVNIRHIHCFSFCL